MRIPTVAKAMNEQIQFVSLLDAPAAEMKPKFKRTDDGKEELKKDAKGRPLYSMSMLEPVELLADGSKRKARNVYLSVIEPTDIQAFSPYQLDGMVFVECYSTRDGLLTVITADRVVKQQQAN